MIYCEIEINRYNLKFMQFKVLLKKFTYHNIRHKIKQILLKMGENDFYPQLPKPRYSILTNSQRFEFWNYLAKKNKSFKYFYQDKPESCFDKTPPIEKDNKYYNDLREFYKNGVAEIENFFDVNEHQLILKFFNNNTIKNLENFGRQNIICLDQNLNSIIYKKTKIFEKILFGKFFKQQNYMFQSILKKTDKNSPFGTSALLHPDRFIPSIKLIYFPTEVKIDPFEYALGSHVINENFKKNILLELKNEMENGELLRKAVIDNRDNEKKINEILLMKSTKNQSNFEIDNFKLKKFNSKSNTLLIVATHGLHRRSQSEDKDASGVRNNMTISYYNEFTRYDLLKNFICR